MALDGAAGCGPNPGPDEDLVASISVVRSLLRYRMVLPRPLREGPVVVWDPAGFRCLVGHSGIEARPGLVLSRVALAYRDGCRCRVSTSVPFWCVGDTDGDFVYLRPTGWFMARGYAYLESSGEIITPYVLLDPTGQKYASIDGGGIARWSAVCSDPWTLRIAETPEPAAGVHTVDTRRLSWRRLDAWRASDFAAVPPDRD